MSWLIPTAAGSVFAILLMSTTALAHGCHQSWQQSDLQGWHRHGQRCETRQGQGVTHRSKQGRTRSRSSSAISLPIWAATSPPISCCGTPELREGLKCLEYVSDAPQAAREPRCHAAQDVFRLLIR